jgi:hypothetical protein
MGRARAAARRGEGERARAGGRMRQCNEGGRAATLQVETSESEKVR